jgi:hypothetical protein
VRRRTVPFLLALFLSSSFSAGRGTDKVGPAWLTNLDALLVVVWLLGQGCRCSPRPFGRRLDRDEVSYMVVDETDESSLQ